MSKTKMTLAALVAAVAAASALPSSSAIVFGDACDVALDTLVDALNAADAAQIAYAMRNADDECRHVRDGLTYTAGHSAGSYLSNEPLRECAASKDYPRASMTVWMLVMVKDNVHANLPDMTGQGFAEVRSDGMKVFQATGASWGFTSYGDGTGAIHLGTAPVLTNGVTGIARPNCWFDGEPVCKGEGAARYTGAFVVEIWSPGFNNCNP